MKPSSYKYLYLAGGIALRIALIAFGRYQDAHSAVPYTDVDYSVFSDAAGALVHGCPLPAALEAAARGAAAADVDDGHPSTQHTLALSNLQCARGVLPETARFLLLNDPSHSDHDSAFEHDSPMLAWATACYSLARPLFNALASLGDPYARPTYRYTPFLALALTPIHLFGWQDFGKLLFAASDVACAVLMWLILDGRRHHAAPKGKHVHLPGLVWLLNPLPAQISTRGSSEGLVGLAVLLFLYFFLCANPEAPLGMAVVHASASTTADSTDAVKENGATVAAPAASAKDNLPQYRPLVPESALPLEQWSLSAWLSPILLGLAVHLKLFPVIYGVPVLAHLAQSTQAAYDPVRRRQLDWWSRHCAGIKFGAVAFVTFMLANAVAWLLWGEPFLTHTFLYHLHRRDHRHNFSPYFLSSYLFTSLSSPPPLTASVSVEERILSSPLFSFVPQALLVTVIGWRVGRRDVVAALMAQTLAFVAWNKVCTSQYFLWFLWFLPLVLPSLQMGRTRAVLVAVAWVGAQALWLAQAYQLEFKARDVFDRIWASSLVLLAVHAVMLVEFLRAWAKYRLSFFQPASQVVAPAAATQVEAK